MAGLAQAQGTGGQCQRHTRERRAGSGGKARGEAGDSWAWARVAATSATREPEQQRVAAAQGSAVTSLAGVAATQYSRREQHERKRGSEQSRKQQQAGNNRQGTWAAAGVSHARPDAGWLAGVRERGHG